MAGSNGTTADEAATRRAIRVRPLKALLPFALRYKGRLLGALVALVAASAATLVVPVAVKSVIDHGFSAANADRINGTFLALAGVVLWLSAASALRYYLVMTLGERVVTDLRAAVFDHLMRLSPAFFDTAQSGRWCRA